MATFSVPNSFQAAVTATGLQLDQNFATVSAYINNPLNRNNYANDSGTTNTFSIALNPAPAGYSAGLEITFRSATTNSGAAVINVNALGDVPFILPSGAALAGGEITVSQVVTAAYDGANFQMQTAPNNLGTPPVAASQAQMETATSAVTFSSPARQQYHPAHPKAVCFFLGTTTGTFAPLYGYGVNNVVRVGTGTYSIALTTAFETTAWAWLINQNADRSTLGSTTQTTTGVSFVLLRTVDSTPQDTGICTFVAWGNQA